MWKLEEVWCGSLWVECCYDRIKLYDEAHSGEKNRYDIIEDTSAGNLTVIENLQDTRVDDILLIMYAERAMKFKRVNPVRHMAN